MTTGRGEQLVMAQPEQRGWDFALRGHGGRGDGPREALPREGADNPTRQRTKQRPALCYRGNHAKGGRAR